MNDATKKVVPTTPKASTKKVASKKKGQVIPANIRKMGTKAEKIRALWMSNRWTRLQIANVLGISFQHVYNTTKRPTKGFDPKKFNGPKKS